MRFLLLLPILFFSCKGEKKESQNTSNVSKTSYLYVKSVNGANLRNGASTQAQTIINIPFGSKVKILDNSEFPEWYKVDYNNNYGYLHISTLGDSQEIADKVPEKTNRDQEVNQAREIYNNVDKYIYATIGNINADCLGGGGEAQIVLHNNTPRDLERVNIDVSMYRSGGSNILEQKTISLQNVPANTPYVTVIDFNRGCEVKASVSCINSNWLGLYSCGMRGN